MCDLVEVGDGAEEFRRKRVTDLRGFDAAPRGFPISFDSREPIVPGAPLGIRRTERIVSERNRGAFAIFWVDGAPKPQPAKQHMTFRVGDKVRVRAYEKGSAEEWKSFVALAARPFLRPAPIDEVLALVVEFYFPRPKTLMRERDPVCEIRHAGKPDHSNLLKAFEDALQLCGLIRNDSLFQDEQVRKWYCPLDGRPGALVSIRSLGPDPRGPLARRQQTISDALDAVQGSIEEVEVSS